MCVLSFLHWKKKGNIKNPLLTNDVDTPYFHTHLEGIFNTILSHSFIVLLRGSYFICHVTQNEEGLLSSDADQFTRVWPEDLGKLKTRGENSKGQNEIEEISELVTLMENRLKHIKTKSKPVLRVWAGSRCDGSAPCSPSHKTPGHSLTSPQARNLHRFLQKRNTSSEQYSGNFQIRSLLQNNVHITFSSKVRLKRFLLLEVFEDFDDTVAFSDGISVIKRGVHQ